MTFIQWQQYQKRFKLELNKSFFFQLIAGCIICIPNIFVLEKGFVETQIFSPKIVNNFTTLRDILHFSSFKFIVVKYSVQSSIIIGSHISFF
jgi:hypothetical protein